MHMLYTFGYGWRKTNEVLAELPGLVMDVRYSPFSRLDAWRKPELQRALGGRYFHNWFLGNAGYKENTIRLQDAEKGMLILSKKLEEQPVTLLCGCLNLQVCHRLVIANMARQMWGVEVEHLVIKPPQSDSKPVAQGPSQLTLF